MLPSMTGCGDKPDIMIYEDTPLYDFLGIEEDVIANPPVYLSYRDGQYAAGEIKNRDKLLYIWEELSQVELTGEYDDQLVILDGTIAFYFTMKDGSEYTIGFETTDYVSMGNVLYNVKNVTQLKGIVRFTEDNLK